jgi:hypothetical protein
MVPCGILYRQTTDESIRTPDKVAARHLGNDKASMVEKCEIQIIGVFNIGEI